MNRRELLQSLMALPVVKSVEVAKVSANDVIVIEIDGNLSGSRMKEIHDQGKMVWPDNKIVVLDDRIRVRVMRSDAT